jgi:hypothetical protein
MVNATLAMGHQANSAHCYKFTTFSHDCSTPNIHIHYYFWLGKTNIARIVSQQYMNFGSPMFPTRSSGTSSTCPGLLVKRVLVSFAKANPENLISVHKPGSGWPSKFSTATLDSMRRKLNITQTLTGLQLKKNIPEVAVIENGPEAPPD